ncbi:MAG: P-loop NTPase fold protein [Clostridia bacterium]|nr:P-loop NTPase fold protein [Clostridia bacterium]
MFKLDKKINLKEENVDLLNTSIYAETILEAIEKVPSKENFTIGLFGEWGSGKSSIVETVEAELMKSDEKQYKVINYDAWKYSNDSFRRTFLLEVQKELSVKKLELFDSFYTDKQDEVEAKTVYDNKTIYISLFFFGVAFLSLLLSDINIESKLTLSVLISVLGWLINLFNNNKFFLKQTVVKPKFFSPEQFEECFSEMICETVLENKKCKILNWIDMFFGKKVDKLIIVIDNIDRCHSEQAYSLLTDVKNFLGKHNNVIFLIPVDEAAIKRHLENYSVDNAEEFLRKIFNVSLKLPIFKELDLFDYAVKINESNSFDFDINTLDLISKEYASNPRRIIQIMNNLELEKVKFLKDKELEDIWIKYENVICKILIIKEEWPVFYKKLSKDYSLIRADLSEEKIRELLEIDELNTKVHKLFNFLNRTKNYTTRTSDSILEAIIYNKKGVEGISSEIITSIENKNFEEIIGHYEKANKLKLIDYIVRKLEVAIKLKKHKGEALNLFEIILTIDGFDMITRGLNIRIQDAINGSVGQFLFYINEVKALILYNNNLMEQDINYLREAIKSNLSGGSFLVNNRPDYSQEMVDVNKSILLSILKYNIDKSFAKEIKKSASELYFSEETDLNLAELNINDITFDTIIDKTFIDNLLQKASSIYENPYWNEYKYILDKAQYKSIISGQGITKINSTYLNFDAIGNEGFKGILFEIQKVVTNLKNKDLNKELKEVLAQLYSKVKARMNHPSYNMYNWIIATENKEEILDKYIELLFKIYHVFGGEIKITEELEKCFIDDYARENIYDKFNSYYNKTKFHFKSMSEMILRNADFNNDKFIAVFNTGLDRNTFEAADVNLIKSKLKDAMILVREGNDKVVSVFEKMLVEEKFINIIKEVIAEQDLEEIKKVPIKIKKIFFEEVLDNLKDYLEDIEMVSNIFEEYALARKKIINLIIRMLQDKDEIDTAIELAKKIDKKLLGKVDYKRLKRELDEKIGNEEFDEELREKMTNVF